MQVELNPLLSDSTFKIFFLLTRGSATAWGSKQCWDNIKAYTFPYKYQNHITASAFHTFIQDSQGHLQESVVWSPQAMVFAELTQGPGGTCVWKLAAEAVNIWLIFLPPDVTGFKHRPVVKPALWLGKQTADQDAFPFPQKPMQLHP